MSFLSPDTSNRCRNLSSNNCKRKPALQITRHSLTVQWTLISKQKALRRVFDTSVKDCWHHLANTAVLWLSAKNN